jgi:FlaA1/EpsC-like NDP-sugar epimerase
MRLRNLVRFIHPRAAVVLHDLAMVALAWWLAKVLRYALMGDVSGAPFVAAEFVIVLAVQGATFAWTGLYRGLWRFASLPDLWNIVRAALIGALTIGVLLFLYNRLATVPRSVLVIYPLLLILLLGLPRLAYRFWKDSRLDLFQAAPAQRVLVLGAGRAGEALARDLRRDSRYRVVGFIDDSSALRGARVHDIPVLGDSGQLTEIARESAAQMLLIAMPSASSAQMRRIVALCEDCGLPFRTVPRLQDVVAGRAQRNELKDVAIEDLLGRDAVQLDWTAIREGIAGRSVLITGGGGSIGSELCRQVARLGAGSLTILDACEFNLYRITHEISASDPELRLRALLGDCGDAVAVERAFAQARPDLVFHAAAYKHVPLLEEQLREAVRNNVLATETVAAAADRHRCAGLVLISTDKAVNPTSVMGACKRLAELVVQAHAARSATRYITVRFGNVLDSAGSVVPLFREQIARGGPLTVTHPEVTRYFMTIPEACLLILQAALQGRGGEIFALDMGDPVRIRDLAEQMIRLAGKQPGRDIAIVYTGLRPGEKLFEELFHPQEQYAPTAHAKLFLAQPRALEPQQIDAAMREARAAVDVFDEEALRRMLGHLLPAFQPGHAAAPPSPLPATILQGDSA